MEQNIAGAMFALALILEVGGSLGAILLGVFRWVPRRRAALIASSLAIAAVQTGFCVGLLGAGIAAADSGQPIPLAWRVTALIVGTPLMHLLQLPPRVFAPAGRWWGDDANLMIALAILNGLLWGVALAWLVARWRWPVIKSAAA